MSHLSWLLESPYVFFTFGTFLLFLGTVQTYLEKAWLRGGGWIYRAKEPRRYWVTVATYYLCGAASIGLFWYLVNVHPR